jgi:hypothetical protein
MPIAYPISTRPDAEVVVPFSRPKSELALSTRIRSTWLTTSILTLKSARLYERYLTKLPPEHHDTIRSNIAGGWVSTEVALAHYAACDSLGLGEKEQLDLGREAGRRVHGSVLSAMVRLAKNSGVTPWAALAQVDRLWAHSVEGGGIAVFKVGPKEARVEIVGFPCARVPYCRIGFRGVGAGALELFATALYAREVPELCSPTSLAYRVSWA